LAVKQIRHWFHSFIVSQAEQADDNLIMSTFFPAFQHKVTMFWFWGANKRCFVSAKKSKWLIFGPLPSTLPVLRIGDLVVELVHEFKCVSIWFSSVHANVFARHYAIKASKARNIVHQSIDTLGMLLRWGRFVFRASVLSSALIQ
jgi:hypothetical protein